MAFCCQVNDLIGLEAVKCRRDGRSVAYVNPCKAIAGRRLNFPQRREIACIGQLVEIEDRCPGTDQGAANSRSYEACATGDQNAAGKPFSQSTPVVHSSADLPADRAISSQVSGFKGVVETHSVLAGQSA